MLHYRPRAGLEAGLAQLSRAAVRRRSLRQVMNIPGDPAAVGPEQAEVVDVADILRFEFAERRRQRGGGNVVQAVGLTYDDLVHLVGNEHPGAGVGQAQHGHDAYRERHPVDQRQSEGGGSPDLKLLH